jgi:hypothetical protein
MPNEFVARRGIISLSGITGTTISKSGGTATQYLMADGSVSTLTNPITGTGTDSQITYWTGTNTTTGSNAFTFNPSISGTGNSLSFTPTLTATANSQTLVGLEINPTFSNGAFTSVTNHALRIPSYYTTNSQIKVGGLELQSYSLNNAWLGENIYFSGTGFKTRATGKSMLFYFYGSEGQFRSYASNPAGTTVSGGGSDVKLKFDELGNFGVGPSISETPGSFSGSKLYLNGSSGNVGIGTTSPTSLLELLKNNPNGGGFLNIINTNTAMTGKIADINFKLSDSAGTIKNAGYIQVIPDTVNIASGASMAFFTRKGDTDPTESMRISNTGNVGIGTTSPSSAKLQVKGDNGTAIGYFFNNTGTAGQVLGLAVEAGTNSSDYALSIASSLGTPYLRVRGDGNVGIGTTSPSERLEVSNTYRDNTSGLFTAVVSSTTSQATGYGGSIGFQGVYTGTSLTSFGSIMGAKENSIDGNTAGYLALFTRTNAAANIERMRITSAGNVGIGTTSPTQKLSIGGVGSAISFDTTGASGTSLIQTVLDYELSIKNNRGTSSEIRVGNDVLNFFTNSSERMRINSAGNVGIGTTSPSSLLTVNGETRILAGNSLNFNRPDNGAASSILMNSSNQLVFTSPSGATFTGNVGIGTTSPQSPLHIIAASSADNALFQEWSYTSASTDIYSLMLKQTVTANVVRYNFSMVNNSTAYDNMLVFDRGNIGIGTTSPGYKLDVQSGSVRFLSGNSSNPALIIGEAGGAGTTNQGTLQFGDANSNFKIQGGNDYVGMIFTVGSERMRITSGGFVNINNTANTTYQLYVNGTIYATGDVIAYSDASVKTNIKTIENPIQRIMKSRGVLYDRTDIDSKDNMGFIAQELEEQFPELISTDDKGVKGVKYQNAVAVLFEAIKEQQNQINELKTIINGITK